MPSVAARCGVRGSIGSAIFIGNERALAASRQLFYMRAEAKKRDSASGNFSPLSLLPVINGTE